MASETSLLSEMFAGAGASAVTSALLYPVDLVKIRLQSQLKGDSKVAKRNTVEKDNSKNYTSATDAAVKILQSEGVAGFYVGVLPYVLRQAWGDAVNLGYVS